MLESIRFPALLCEKCRLTGTKKKKELGFNFEEKLKLIKRYLQRAPPKDQSHLAKSLDTELDFYL